MKHGHHLVLFVAGTINIDLAPVYTGGLRIESAAERAETSILGLSYKVITCIPMHASSTAPSEMKASLRNSQDRKSK